MAISARILAVVLLITMSGVPTPAVSRSLPSPTQHVQEHLNRVLALASDASLSADERRSEVRKATQQAFDFPEFARRVLGPHKDSMTAGEGTRFVNALSALVEDFYVWRLSPFYSERALQFGDHIRYVGESLGRNTAVVAMIIRRHGRDVPVEARLTRARNEWRICDLVVEGVALADNYAAQVNQLLRTRSTRELLATVEQKQAALVSSQAPLLPSAAR
jgi:ABC-type transporter MlaC component